MGRGVTIAIIWGIFCLLLAGWGGWYFYDRYNYVERTVPMEGKELGVREKLKTAIAERRDEEKRLEQEVKNLKDKKAELDVVRAEYFAKMQDMNLAEVHEGATREFLAYMEAWKEKTAREHPEAQSAAKASIGDMSAHRDEGQKRNDEQVKKLKVDINNVTTEIEQYKADLAKAAELLDKDRVRWRNRLSDAERKTGELVSREPPVGLPACGRVLTSDPERDLAVIDLGSRHGVKPGMRFEVFQIRHGNQRVHKGMLEVKTASPEVSSCTILVKSVGLPRCPVCTFTANEPEQLFCPRCTSPGTAQGAQKLNDTPVTVVRGKVATDPIVPGDALYNPLFSKGGKRRYAICGQPLVQRKDYSEKAVREILEFYGNEVEDAPSARTDVLIALRGGDAIKMAKDLGIPIVYEWELFRYLER